MLTSASMRNEYRGARIELFGNMLPDVLEALVIARAFTAAHVRSVREAGHDTAFWIQQTKELHELSDRIWELARKATRKRDRERERKRKA